MYMYIHQLSCASLEKIIGGRGGGGWFRGIFEFSWGGGGGVRGTFS